MASQLSEIIDLHCLLSNALRTIISYILSSFSYFKLVGTFSPCYSILARTESICKANLPEDIYDF